MVFYARDNAKQQHHGKKNPTLRKDYPIAYLEWQRIVTKKMSHLSKPQAVVLAMWSFGAITHSCGLSTVTVFLAQLLGQKENKIRERLRQWYKEGSSRGGRKPASIDVQASFVTLLQWILSWWSPTEKSLVLAADASTLGERFTVLLIAIFYRGCGIPVARENCVGDGKRKLETSLARAVPASSRRHSPELESDCHYRPGLVCQMDV